MYSHIGKRYQLCAYMHYSPPCLTIIPLYSRCSFQREQLGDLVLSSSLPYHQEYTVSGVVECIPPQSVYHPRVYTPNHSRCKLYAHFLKLYIYTQGNIKHPIFNSACRCSMLVSYIHTHQGTLGGVGGEEFSVLIFYNSGLLPQGIGSNFFWTAFRDTVNTHHLLNTHYVP